MANHWYRAGSISRQVTGIYWWKVAVACDGRVLVTMLTGMGQDGLAGTKKVIEAGGAAIGQDEASSVVWGMPGAIAQAGLCHAVLPLPKIAPQVLEILK